MHDERKKRAVDQGLVRVFMPCGAAYTGKAFFCNQLPPATGFG